ncbi:DNA polymerase Y family protein [Variovorax beijingensis]|uniref:DNA polymerase Y family protein n=1 Tax=Variovorax beijingensis TaxID=2496117 RepID=A0ABY0A889_9BURK|nr:DNA polymerase Y family protein [Variovorax beijingensis]RSZ38615.1 DNA polymerase Y family protein [Variovorax beijingensis]
MLWAALLPDSLPDAPQPRTEALDGLATWCLQFTPRVAVLEALLLCPAVVMEVEQSLRLFGGKRRLVERVREECPDLGVRQLSWAPTSLAALAVARAGLSNGFAKPLTQLLDALPIETLTQVAAHQATLARLGCRTLGQVRALPRGGLSRRFDAQLLATLDQAYGLRPETYPWAQLPETFRARLELMARVEHAPAMLFGARRLMLQMAGWLMARRSGVTAFTLRWCHDAMRARTAGDGGELTVRTAQATRDTEHLMRLLAEHLGKVELLAPVGDLELLATEVQSLEEKSLSMLPEARQSGESLALVLERIAARLGPDRVLRPVILEDHRLEWMCRWRPAPEPAPRVRSRTVDVPQPTFILPKPLRLATQANRPIYQGVLQLLAGPHRVEGGWWDRTTQEGEEGEGGQETTRQASRDYWVAVSEHAGVLWIFQMRLAQDETAWFLHGTFA